MKTSFLSVFWLLAWLLFQPSVIVDSATVMDARGYIEKVARRLVEILETRYITGTALPVDDYVAPINISDKGIRIDGEVSFHSAFVAKIDSMTLDMQRYTETLLDTEMSVQASIKWHDIGIVLDFDANLVDYKGPGTLLVTYNQFDFPLKIIKRFNETEPEGSLYFMSIDNSNNIVTIGHPNNKHVQMIARGIKTSFDYRDKMIESFRNWNFENLVALVIREIPFPEICYNC
ncbi:uncharacterized protein LOC126568993 [Anopheles aquasalis]|uniref:uncharacterized protein LOC126568993 n=1 Tax=Anopheles aquasalis TaxID=42839 RepID=UPI00215A638B|nr:uncharacterized protein LOC126568993 [Anopheles aquasalis]